jgi:ferredoxin
MNNAALLGKIEPSTTTTLHGLERHRLGSSFTFILNQELNGQIKRLYSMTSMVGHADDDIRTKKVPITYIQADGTSKTVDAEIGMNLMNVAHENDIELEGACGGELACSTCHLIFEKKIYDTLPEMEEEELDMLDLAFEVTDTSRLGCQILVKENFAGMTVKIPDDGF